MRKTYITAIPLQFRQDLEAVSYRSDAVPQPQPTRFPIIEVMRQTFCPGDTAQVLAIRQENTDTTRNYQFLLEELAQLGVTEQQVTVLTLPEDQRAKTLIGLCRDLVDAIPQVTRTYACITYGTKPISVVTLMALSCAEATHTELEVGGVYYGETRREGGKIVDARLWDIGAVYHLAGLVSDIRDSDTAEQVFRQLLWMSEYQEG